MSIKKFVVYINQVVWVSAKIRCQGVLNWWNKELKIILKKWENLSKIDHFLQHLFDFVLTYLCSITQIISNYHYGSYLDHFVHCRVFVYHRYAWLTLIPFHRLPWSFITPVLRKGSKNSTPEPTTQSPHSKFIGKECDIGAFGAHFNNRMLNILFFFEIDGSPFGAGS